MIVTITGQTSGIQVTGLNGEDINIYPNPAADGIFTINGLRNAQLIRIMDLDGRIVKNINAAGKTSVELRLNVSPGIYVIRISDNKESIYKKIMIP